MSAQSAYFPKVSVLIPIYKVEAYVEQCLGSVLSQTYSNLEIILLDDASPDRSMEIVESLIKNENGHSLRILKHSQNKGQAVVRRSLVEEARGEYLLFLDSDDYWTSQDVVEKIVKNMEEENADLLIFDYWEKFRRKDYYRTLSPTSSRLELIGMFLDGRLPCFLWNKCFRRELFLQHSNIWQEGVNMWEDVYNVILYTLYVQKVTFMQEAFVCYRRTNESAITMDFNSQNIQSMEYVHKQVASLLHQTLREDEYSLIEKSIYKQSLTPILVLLCAADYKTMKELLQKYPELHSFAQEIGGVGGKLLRLSLACYRKAFYFLAYLCLRFKSFLQLLK